MTMEQQEQPKIQVDVAGLKKLYRCLEDLRYHAGQANPLDLWIDELFVPDFTYPLMPVKAKDVHSMASHLESLGRARDVLRQIGGLLDERIDTLTAQTSQVFEAFGRGLDSLPYEVLALILEQAADLKSEDPKSPLRLSHVSRRFRNVILSLPKAWSVISSDMNPEWIDTVLERSRSSGIQVQFKGVNDFSDAMHSLAHTLPHAERWRSFTLNAAFRPDLDSVSGFAEFRKRCLNLKLPRLTHAEFHFDDNHPTPIETRLPSAHLFTTWDVPNLTSLTMTNSIPVLFQCPNLTKFTMRFECLTTFSQRNLRPFFEFLAGNPQLKELCLHFSCYFPAVLQTPQLVHNGIETLSVEVEYAEFEWIPQRAAILAIFASISLPKLSTLNVNASFEGGKSTSDYWDDEDDISVEDDGLEVGDMLVDMLPLPVLCPEIKNCSLRVVGYELTHPSLSLHRVLHAMPNLQHLRIDTNLDLEPSLCACVGLSQPKLRTLELNNCEEVLVEWIGDVVHWLKKTDAWERFRMLTVRACPELPKAELLKFVPREKLTWIREIMFEDDVQEYDPLDDAFEDGLPLTGSHKDAPLYMFDDECVGTRLLF